MYVKKKEFARLTEIATIAQENLIILECEAGHYFAIRQPCLICGSNGKTEGCLLVPPPKQSDRRCKYDWDSVDWEKQDIRIAEELGCSREGVRQKRKKLRKPKSLNHYHQKPRPPTEEHKKILALSGQGLTNAEIARRTGVHPATVQRIHGPSEPIQAIKEHWRSIDWENEKNVDIAEREGKFQSTISRIRRKYAPHTIGTLRGKRVVYSDS